MRSKNQYQIHALIGKCHLYSTLSNSYMVTLKLGARIVAHTEFKYIKNCQIDFNRELILKVDSNIYQITPKLSIIITMLNQQKQRTVISTLLADYKVKGKQKFQIAPCLCSKKNMEINLEFEIVNQQNHNNSYNNKFHSPNLAQIKDMKSTLALPRQVQSVKSSRISKSPSLKQMTYTFEEKSIKNIKIQAKQTFFQSIQSITTKNTLGSLQSQANTIKQGDTMKKLKQQINYEIQLNNLYSNQKKLSIQIQMLLKQNQKKQQQNECLSEMLKIQQVKSSAALNYLQFIIQKITQYQQFNHQFNHQFYQSNIINEFNSIIRQIKLNQLMYAFNEQILNHKSIINHQTQIINNNICIYQKINDSTNPQFYNSIDYTLVQKQKQQNDKLKRQITQLHLKLVKIESKLSQKQSIIWNQIIQIQNNNQKNTKSNKNIQQLRRKILSSQQNAIINQKSISNYEKSIQKDKQIIDIHKKTIQNNKLTLQNLNQTIQIIQIQTKNKQKSIQRLELQIHEQTMNITKIQKLRQSQKHQYQLVKQQLIQSKNKINSLQIDVKRLIKANDHLKIQNERLRKMKLVKTPQSSQIKLNKQKHEYFQQKHIQHIINQINSYIQMQSTIIIQDQFKLNEPKNSSSQLHQHNNKSRQQIFQQIQLQNNRYPFKRNQYNFQYDSDNVKYFNNFDENNHNLFDHYQQEQIQQNTLSKQK